MKMGTDIGDMYLSLQQHLVNIEHLRQIEQKVFLHNKHIHKRDYLLKTQLLIPVKYQFPTTVFPYFT